MKDSKTLQRANKAMLLLELLAEQVYPDLNDRPETPDWSSLSKDFNELIKVAFPKFYEAIEKQTIKDAQHNAKVRSLNNKKKGEPSPTS